MRLCTLCLRLSERQSLFPHDTKLQRTIDAFYATGICFRAREVQVVDRTGTGRGYQLQHCLTSLPFFHFLASELPASLTCFHVKYEGHQDPSRQRCGGPF